MKLEWDDASGHFAVERDGARREHALHSRESFAALTELWLRVGWALRASYRYTWLGRPVIQLPDDLLRVQEVLFRLQPDVIVETGVAHGGSLVFYASVCALLGRGRVLGVDVEIRPANRAALESHPLARLITLVEGSSVDAAVVARVRDAVRPGESVLVLLDSNHTRDHVRAELEAYAPLVTSGSYIVATDGIMENLVGCPGAAADWSWNNPRAAAADFAAAHPEFALEEPRPMFDESRCDGLWPTYWPGAWLRRR